MKVQSIILAFLIKNFELMLRIEAEVGDCDLGLELNLVSFW
jgi:hypothetical protein